MCVGEKSRLEIVFVVEKFVYLNNIGCVLAKQKQSGALFFAICLTFTIF